MREAIGETVQGLVNLGLPTTFTKQQLDALGVAVSEVEVASAQSRETRKKSVHCPDVLMNLSGPELQALAEGMLSPPHQQRLGELLQRNRAGTMSSAEETELDRLLEHVDHMNVLKARAKYTLQRL
jgi:hypothetical protein